MEACLAVEKSLGGADRAGELIVEKAAVVIEPVGTGGLRVLYPLGQVAAVRDGENVQRRIFAAVLRQSIDHVLPVRRCAPPVEGHVPGRAAHQGGIDEDAVGTGGGALVGLPGFAGIAGLADEKLVVVGASRALREENPAARALHAAGRSRITGQLLDALQQPGPGRQLVEYGAGVVVLALEVRQPVLVLVVLHPAVGVAERFTEVGIAHDIDARDRSLRNSGAGGRGSGAGRIGGRHKALRHERHRQGAGAAGEKLTAIESDFHFVLRQLLPPVASGNVLKSSAAPFHNTWMPMQTNRNADRRTTMLVPVAPINPARRAECR